VSAQAAQSKSIRRERDAKLADLDKYRDDVRSRMTKSSTPSLKKDEANKVCVRAGVARC
jgi:hypothetical protein